MIDKEDENHELDDFIRQKLNNLHVAFDEQAWVDLQGKLHTFNQQKANQKAKRLWTRLSVAAVVVLLIPAFILAYYDLSLRQTRKNTTVSQTKQHIAPQHHTKPSDTQKKARTNHQDRSQNSLQSPQIEVDKVHSSQKLSPKGSKSPTNPEEDQANFNLGDHATLRTILVSEEPTKKLNNALNLPKNQGVSAKHIDTNTEPYQSKKTPIHTIPSNHFAHDYTALQNNIPEFLSLNIQNKASFHPIHLGLSISPELDQVGIAQKNTWSANIGALMEWTLNHHLGLRLGMSYTKKQYEVIDFNEPASPGSPFVILNSDRVDLVITESSRVQSRVIDLPIELKYTFDRNRKVRFFVAAGPSSYIYLNQSIEKETVGIDPNNSTRVSIIDKNTEEVKDNKFYWLSTINLGIGLETNIFHRIKTQINPYYKFALRDTGADGNQISSFGIRTVFLHALR